MNKIFILILSCLTILLSEDKVLWDLGITIKSKDIPEVIKNTNDIKPLIANTQIEPLYKKELKVDSFKNMNLTIGPKHLVKLLYLNNQYFKLTEYIQNLNSEEAFLTLNDEQLLIYADALYQIGDYNHAIKNIDLLSDDYPIDEKYFLLALYNKKSGNINRSIKLLNSLISECPDSEYIRLAKLQTRELK